MQSFFWLMVATLLTLIGDFLIKLASDSPSGLKSLAFLGGALAYGAPAFAWFFLMQQHSLSTIGVFYSSATLIFIALLGAVAFGERLELRDGLGIGLALAAVLVMYRGA